MAADTIDFFYSEAWRYQGHFTRANRFKAALPGFGIATVAFIAFNIGEYFLAPKDNGHGHH